MQLHTFKIKMSEIMPLFFNKNKKDLDEYIEDLCSTESDYAWEMARDIVDSKDEAAEAGDYTDTIMDLIETNYLPGAILDKVGDFLPNLERLYTGDEDIKLNIFFSDEDAEERNGFLDEDVTYTFTIETKDLENVMRIGMNAYGMFDWDAHSQGDKDHLTSDPYYILREMLHYYEACEHKVELNMPDYDDLIEMPSMEEAMEALEKEKQNANPMG